MFESSIRLAITGRRHIVPSSERAVVASAREFLSAVAKTRHVEIYTGLAVGADSIAARLALELRETDSSARTRLIGVLPAALERYERDFKETPDASGVSERDAFRALLSRCDETICLADPEEDARDPLACYARLGAFLVERCSHMLAFWNGNVAERKPGGTVDVALTMAENLRPGGFVYCVSTPEVKRKKNPDGSKSYFPEPTENAGKVAILREKPKDLIQFGEAMDAIETIKALLSE